MLSPKNFHDVPLAIEEHGPFDAHQVILSSARMSTRVNSQFVAASMTESFSVWSLGGEASQNLAIRNGSINISFNISLGHPSAPFPLPSVPPPQKPRHRGTAEKERGRQRAARHQTAKASAPPAPPVPVTDSVVNTPNPNPVTTSATPSAKTVATTDSVDYTVFNCDICEYVTSMKCGVLTHKGHKHKEEVHKEDENESLEISVVIEEREEDINYLLLANSTFDETETELVGNDPLRLKLQENGFAKIVISPDSPLPKLVLHPKLGIGKIPRLTKVQEKKCVEYTFEKGTFAIEIFP